MQWLLKLPKYRLFTCVRHGKVSVLSFFVIDIQSLLILSDAMIITHYDNKPMQFCVTFHDDMNGILRMKICDNFLIFGPNINEAVQKWV